jgi:NAD(P)-dependent dehydrogenase (short-subunit alcohol dehydrogenase family)
MILKDKVVIVTGGNGLLGREMLKDIRIKGGVAVSADINNETDLEKGIVFCDIRELDSIKKTIDVVVRKYGRLDALVNNAYPRTDDWACDFLELKEDSLKTNVDWQLNSYVLFCQQAIKAMLKTGGGSIVNIASIYGVVGNDFTIYENTGMQTASPYAAIKGGIINFTRFLASKYGKDNIRVNTVSPGGIFDHQNENFVKAYEHKVPLKRMGNPDDIAPAVSFLLSDEAKYITGHNLIADGGWTAI